VQKAPLVAQTVASIQPPFDLYRSSTKPCANFFPRYLPAISVPTDRVVRSDLAGHTHAQNFLRVMFWPQSSIPASRISFTRRS
jgi:hypothetical protein